MGALYRRKEKCLDCPGRTCRRCRGRGKVSLKTWWAKWYVDGRPIRRSCKTRVKEVAKAKLNDWEGKGLRGEIADPAVDRLRFDDLLERVLADYRINGKRSLEWVEQRAAHLKLSFAGRRATSISTPEIAAYVAKRQDEKAANATVNRELAILKRGFSLAIRAGLLSRRPYIPRLREDNARQGFIGPIEALAVRQALPEDLRPLFDFLYETGWRKQEALGLTWDRVDLQAGTARLTPEESKNREGRLVHLTPSLLEVLRGLRKTALAQGYSVPQVFTRAGRPVLDFRGAWEGACKRAGLPGLLIHDLRRSAVRNLVRAGVPERVAMQISGHKTRSVFDRYNIMSEGDLAEAARKMAAAGTVLGTGEVDAEGRGVLNAGAEGGI